MLFYSYRGYPEDHAGAVYLATLADAHAMGKELDPVWRCNVRICLLDIPVDKLGVLVILNNGGPHQTGPDQIKPLRTWTLTARGGLNELTEEAA